MIELLKLYMPATEANLLIEMFNSESLEYALIQLNERRAAAPDEKIFDSIVWLANQHVTKSWVKIITQRHRPIPWKETGF